MITRSLESLLNKLSHQFAQKDSRNDERKRSNYRILKEKL